MAWQVRSARPRPSVRPVFRRPDPERLRETAEAEEAIARAERHLLDPERLREMGEIEEAIARTERQLDELNRRYLEIVRAALAAHAGERVGKTTRVVAGRPQPGR